jgi:hypothetical protein
VPGAGAAGVGRHRAVVERRHARVERVLRQEDRLAVEVDREPVGCARSQRAPDAGQGGLEIGEVEHRVREHHVITLAAARRAQEFEQVGAHELYIEPGACLLDGDRIDAALGDGAPALEVAARGRQALALAIHERILGAPEHVPVRQPRHHRAHSRTELEHARRRAAASQEAFERREHVTIERAVVDGLFGLQVTDVGILDHGRPSLGSGGAGPPARSARADDGPSVRLLPAA